VTINLINKLRGKSIWEKERIIIPASLPLQGDTNTNLKHLRTCPVKLSCLLFSDPFIASSKQEETDQDNINIAHE